MSHMAPPPNIQEVLEGLHYPARLNDIIVCAKAHHAASKTMDLLRTLPDQSYDNISEINHVLGKIEESPEDQTIGSPAGSQELEDECGCGHKH